MKNNPIRLSANEMLNTAPAIIYLSDNSTKTIQWCNAYMEKIFGYSLKEMQQMSIEFFRAVMHPDDFPKAIEAKEGFEHGRKEFAGFCRIRKKEDDRWRWVYGTAIPHNYDEAGQVKEVSCVFQVIENINTPAQLFTVFISLLQRMLDEELKKLSKREKGIMNVLSTEKSNKAAAEALFIAVSTLKKHKQNICEKLGHDNFNLLMDLGKLSGGG